MTTASRCSLIVKPTFLSLCILLIAGILSQRAAAQPDVSGRVLERGLSDTHIDNLTNLNSPADEATPFISPDEGTLYFTSYRNTGKATIYKSTRKSLTEWNDPVLFLELPGKENISSLTLTGDGKKGILSCCNRPDGIDQTCDIYECDIIGGEIRNIRSLGETVNSRWWDSQPCISDDGSLLFFTSDRKGGAGGYDIYMCSRNADGSWSSPTLLSFCTSGNELSPKISKDNQTLYFASDDISGGAGGYDIYVVYRTGDNQWTQPKNLGASVNSRWNELFFAIPPNEDALYVASDRPGGVGSFDLYRIAPNPAKPKPKFIAFHGKTLDAETGGAVRTQPDVKITTADNESLDNTGNAREYQAMAPIGKIVRVNAGADGYVNGKIEVMAPSVFSEEGFSEDIKLIPAKVKIYGHVTNVFTRKPIAATVILEELDASNNVIGSQKVNADPNKGGSEFEFDAKVFSKYRIGADVADYEPYRSAVEIPLKREALIRVEKELRLQPSAIDAVMLFFDYDKSDLKDKERPKMDRFIEQVKENPYVRIEVNGHTDDRGSDEYNEKLSARRALTVEEYLLSRGVPRDQLAIVKGFGKSAPLEQGTTEEARAKNRRVEVRIVGKQ
jgi:outer membrane protein OmpA-like peptidoglycan-associated protein